MALRVARSDAHHVGGIGDRPARCDICDEYVHLIVAWACTAWAVMGATSGHPVAGVTLSPRQQPLERGEKPLTVRR